MMGRVKYCRIVRKPFRNKDRYFLQIVMEGSAPAKLEPGTGTMGLDPGVSTMAAVMPGEKTSFLTLADGVKRYEKEIKDASVVYERRRRLTNPRNYNPDGTVRKDTKTFHKTWEHTKGMEQALRRLLAAYAKKTAFVKNSHGRQTNRLVVSCGTVVTEPMDYRALARRAKELSRKDKGSAVKTKSGGVKMVRRYKRRKRFGSSILWRSPALFLCMLDKKVSKYGGTVLYVDLKEYRASQYDHTTGGYDKPALKERIKKVGGHRVQRDLYSAYLLRHMATPKQPDQAACAADFKRFLKQQGAEVARIISAGDTTGNFGLADFLTPAVRA